MTLGTPRPRNWGKETQAAALAIAMQRGKVAYQVRTSKHGKTLWLAGSDKGVTLPFIESCANLINTRRGRWEARHPFDDRLLAAGCSERDVIRATIQAVWQ